MKVDNPLSHEFLLRHPAGAARVLEQLSADDTAALFNEKSAEIVAPVLVAMLPTFAAACVAKMDLSAAAKLMAEISVTAAARIYRLLPPQSQEALSVTLSSKSRKGIRRILDYASVSAGDLMDPKVNMLPDDLTVADAIRRIERYRHSVTCEIYIVDSAHHLLGAIELGKLLTSKHHVRLRDIMKRTSRPVSVHASSEKLLAHPGWAEGQRLPVIERDNTLVGVLDYKRVRETVAPESSRSDDPLENLMSLTGLYWLSMTQLLDSLFSQNETNQYRIKKGERK
ncbi:MAG: CBS domain-containing protein [Gammaproteobacteria bacterium]